MPPGDTVARLGGDEFAVLSEWVGGERDAVALAEHIAAALAVPFDLDDRSLAITVSVGVAVFPPGGTATPQTALYDADAAMYRAKDRGRRRVELADEDLRAKAAVRLEEERALRRAIDDGELRVYFQPVVELVTGRILGTEALVRWQHPQRGLVAPSEFIGLAEDSGLIVDLGALVMAEACRQTSEWNLARAGQPPLFVAVNLSARQLESPGLHDFVEATLANSPGLDPGLLHLEITESVLMDDVEASRASLQALKALGITLVVDDFGTGYSSLVYLRRFPVDALKVDCSFVAGLGRDADDSTIVAAVVGLARALGLATVAEGVETADQATRLLELGCDRAQGFLWSPAVPADELAGLLDRSLVSVSPARARVLIVDDDPVVRDLLRLALDLKAASRLSPKPATDAKESTWPASTNRTSSCSTCSCPAWAGSKPSTTWPASPPTRKSSCSPPSIAAASPPTPSPTSRASTRRLPISAPSPKNSRSSSAQSPNSAQVQSTDFVVIVASFDSALRHAAFVARTTYRYVVENRTVASV